MNQELLYHEVQNYLDDETKLYQDWYKALKQSDVATTYGTPVSILPSLDSIKKMVAKWVTEEQKLLKQVICVQWDYCSQKSHYSKVELLIIAIFTDILSSVSNVPTNTIMTAIILVNEGYLDQLCECKGD